MENRRGNLGARSFPWAGLLFLALVLAPALSRACIGENKKQLEVRYGRAREIGVQNIYTWNGFTVNVFFDKNQLSAMEVFARELRKEDQVRTLDSSQADVPIQELSDKMDADVLARQPELTTDDINQILRLNGGQYGWGGMRAENGQDFWYRGDRKVIAQYKKESKALVLSSID